jgi:hypothetical protein
MSSCPVPSPTDLFVRVVTTGEGTVSAEQRARVCEWLKANGVDPNTVSAHHPITIQGCIRDGMKRRQVICFSEYHLDETGHRYVDPRTTDEAMVVERVVKQTVEIAPDPAFMQEPSE